MGAGGEGDREKYIGECLDSLFTQTFQNFEVIVIDDCSTDNSVEIVKSYMGKFGERLKILQMEKNTGHPGEPRNRGIAVAQGEYIYCLDSDDIITETALEEMYTLGKKFDADVVYCERYFKSEGFGQAFKDNIRITNNRVQKPPFVTEPTLETTDLEERIKNLLNWRYWMSPALKIVKRDLLIENHISFPLLVGSEDDVWSMKILFCAKRFLRIPNICFIRRIHEEGISFGKYTTSDHVQRWMDVTIRALKDFDSFMGEIEFFRTHPGRRYDILARSVRGGFANIFDKCANESAFNVYKIFQEKFGEYLGENDVLVSSLCSYAVSQQKELTNRLKKLEQESQRQITVLETELKGVESKKPIGISIVIPMYNVADFIGEMLDSLLYQTFEEFEVILVDDRSTDNSFEIAQSYVPKFNGRLTLIQLEKNSGGAGEPRNVGLTYTRGEYVIFFDADDFILLSGLETLYRAAKGYDADVVYTSAYYNMLHENDIYLYRDGLAKKLIREGQKDEPTLIVDDQKKLLDQLLCGEEEGNLFSPWSKLVRRELLIQNKIFFPQMPIGEDFIWVINVYCYTKKFLRFSNPFYFYRRYNSSSITRTIRSSQEQFTYWISLFVDWTEALNEFENRTEILKKNPVYCYKASLKHFRYTLSHTKEAQKDFSSQEIYDLLHRELGKEDKFSLVLSLFFSSMDSEMKTSEENSQATKRLNGFITSRIDIQLVPKTGKGDFQILSVSDDKAVVNKPAWFQKNGVGYTITSCLGKIEFVAKADCDGQIRLSLKGLDIRTPEDNYKRIPYWINYNKLTIKGKKLFDTITPAWHGKPYNYNMNVNAGEEVAIQVEWLSDYSYVVPKLLPAPAPAISVVIPMYNAEEYVGECLDSLLIQTFQDFEVIVVDDCSTDNSVKVVESYMEKFNGRLKLTKTKKNSGGGGYVPRNIGLKFAKGEYVIFLDSDDFLLGSALETLYNAAKEYDAEVVYSSSYYSVVSPTDVRFYRDGVGRNLFKAGIEDKTTLTVNDRDKMFQEFIAPGSGEGNFRAPWSKFIRRDYLIKNNIQFPDIVTGGDCVWCVDVYAHANRFLRLPTPLYFYRFYNSTSITRTKRNPAEQLSYWVDAQVAFLKALNEVQNKSKFLRKNPFYCYETVRGGHFRWTLNRTYYARKNLSNKDIYEILYREFDKKNNVSDLIVPFFFSVIDNDERTHEDDLKKLSEFRPTARMDIKLSTKATGGDFKIISLSDNEADVQKPDWFQKGGVGYKIQSYAGKMEIVTKATADGQIRLSLKGLDVRDPEDNSKRIPQWVDYTNLTINGKRILNNRTPAWHDKPYNYTLDVKAGEEIRIQTNWQPHREDTIDVSADVEEIQEISKLRTALDTEKKLHSADIELLRKFSDYFTSRIDIKLRSNDEGKLKILSVSDDKAEVKRAGWLKKNEHGYFIQSYNGKMKIVAKPTADGQIILFLKGLDVRNPEDKSKRIPYWIDYSKLTVNGEIIFDELKPIWHDKPFRYILDVKAGEEITVQVEWLPHKGDTGNVSANAEEMQEKSAKKDALISDLQAALDSEKKVHSEDVELFRKFSDYFTARLDIQMETKAEGGNFQIVSVSDDKAKVTKAKWLLKDNIGYFIQSYIGKLEFVAKTSVDGKITLKLKGKDVRDPSDRSKRIPYWIDYNKLTVNGEVIFDELKPAWHDKPYNYTLDAKADEEIKISVEWLPHRSDT